MFGFLFPSPDLSCKLVLQTCCSEPVDVDCASSCAFCVIKVEAVNMNNNHSTFQSHTQNGHPYPSRQRAAVQPMQAGSRGKLFLSSVLHCCMHLYNRLCMQYEPMSCQRLFFFFFDCVSSPAGGLGVQGNLELKMECSEREEMMHTNHSHSSDSQRSDEESEHRAQGDNSRGNR